MSAFMSAHMYLSTRPLPTRLDLGPNSCLRLQAHNISWTALPFLLASDREQTLLSLTGTPPRAPAQQYRHSAARSSITRASQTARWQPAVPPAPTPHLTSPPFPRSFRPLALPYRSIPCPIPCPSLHQNHSPPFTTQSAQRHQAPHSLNHASTSIAISTSTPNSTHLEPSHCTHVHARAHYSCRVAHRYSFA